MEMNNHIGPTVKRIRNEDMHVLHNFLGLSYTQKPHLSRYSLHIILLGKVLHALV